MLAFGARLVHSRRRGMPQQRVAVRPVRKRAAEVRVEVEQTLVDGDHVAARYRLIAEMRKGHTTTTEVYMFGELASDGRLRRATQVTRTISSG